MAMYKVFLGRKFYSILNHHCNAKVTRVTMSLLLHDGLPLSGYQFSRKAATSGFSQGQGGGAEPGDIKVTLNELKWEFAKDMGVNHPYKPVLEHREQLTQYLPKSQEELPPRSMQDSFVAAIIPLSKNLALQEKYTTFLGSVRLGRLIEDMDIFTVIVARKHILNPRLPKGAKFPQTIVTVLVDQMIFTEYHPKVRKFLRTQGLPEKALLLLDNAPSDPPVEQLSSDDGLIHVMYMPPNVTHLIQPMDQNVNKDIKISGHVSWVSKSTAEVVVWLEQFEDNQWQRLTRGLFLVAARDPTNTYASFVNPINPANEREKIILSGGESRKKRRLDIHSTHVSKTLPTAEEQKMIHSLYTRTTDPADISMSKKILPPGCAWMSNSTTSNVILAQPEDRNLHNTVFGGFIMRQATELSFALGYIYCKHKPRTRSLSDVSFKQPIAVHSLIQMHAIVVYTYKNYIQNLVFAQVYDPVTGKTATTNAFHFTLEAPDMVPEVIPSTYHEAMLYVDGYRHFHKNLKEKGVPNSKL